MVDNGFGLVYAMCRTGCMQRVAPAAPHVNIPLSLNPGVPRLTFSMEFDIDPSTGKVVDRRPCRSVIESCVKLTYGIAQTMLDGKFDPAAESIPMLHGGHSWAQVRWGR